MGSEKMRNLTVRIDEETYRKIEEAAASDRVDRSTAARQLLRRGIVDRNKRQALDIYRAGKCTLWKAAQIADLNIREMIDLAESEKIPAHITPEDVEEAWSWAHGEKQA